MRGFFLYSLGFASFINSCSLWALQLYIEPLLDLDYFYEFKQNSSSDERAVELAQRHRKALGGASMLEPIESLRYWGRVEVGDGPWLPLMVEKVSPRSMRSVIYTPAGPRSELSHEGRSWLLDVDGQIVPASASRSLEMAFAATRFGPLAEWEQLGLELYYNGQTGSEQWHEIEARAPQGLNFIFYLDSETYLLRRVVQRASVEDYSRLLVTDYMAYEPLDGVPFPRRMRGKVEGVMEYVIEVEGVLFNPEDIDVFWNPEKEPDDMNESSHAPNAVGVANP